MKKLIALFFIFLLPNTVFGARLYTTGFEWQSVTAGVELLGSYGTTAPTIDTNIKHSGSSSFHISGNIPTTEVQNGDYTFPSATKVFARWYVYIDSQENNASVTTFLDTYNGATNATSIQISCGASNCTATTYYNNFGEVLPTPFTINFDTWYRIEMLYDSTPADGSEVITILQDGTQVDTVTTATLTQKGLTNTGFGVYNGTAGTISGTSIYFDDIAINNSLTGYQNTYPGEGNIVALVPTGSGDSACTTGLYTAINEVPPSNTAATGAGNTCELDTATSTGLFNMTDSKTAGINSYDTISVVNVMTRMREETAGTSNYFARILSASGGTASSSASVDAGNTTARTNPNSTTAFTNIKTTYVDPSTGSAWTPTGTNSIDNLQAGAGTTDGTPNTWMNTLAVFVEYKKGTAPVTGSKTGAVLWWE